MVISDGATQSNNRIVKFETKNRIPLNVTKVESDVTLVLPNVTTEPSNVRTKIKDPSNVTKVLLDVMLVLPKVTMELLNVRKKIR